MEDFWGENLEEWNGMEEGGWVIQHPCNWLNHFAVGVCYDSAWAVGWAGLASRWKDFMCPRQMPQTAKMVGEAEKLGLRVLADKPIE